MKILHTVAYYDNNQGGGATEVIRQISERLTRRGHDITIATSYSRNPREFILNGVQVKQFPVKCVFNQSVLGIYGAVKEFCQYIQNSNFDIIMNYTAQTWHSDLTCRYLKRLQAKTVLTACGYSGLLGWRKLPYCLYFHRLPAYLRQYDAIVYHSAAYQDKRFGDQHHIRNYRIIPNGIDTCEFSGFKNDFRKTYGISTKYMLLTVGDHYKNKGHHRVIEAFRGLQRDDVTLVIIGRPNSVGLRSCWKLCQQAADKSAQYIRLIPDAPRSQVVAAFSAADIFLSGSYIEAFPLVIIEAMASATPFVAFPSGNIIEMAGGIIVNYISEMSKAIVQLLADSDFLNQLGAAGKQQQQGRYDWEIIVDKYETLYYDLLNSSESNHIFPDYVAENVENQFYPANWW